MPTPKQLYTRKLSEIARRFGDLEEETIKQALAYLKAMRDRLQLELTATEGFNAIRLAELTRAVDDLTTVYQAQLTSLANGSIRQSSRLGALSVVEPIQAAGLSAAFFQPTPAQLNVLLDFSADLVKGITDEMRRTINSQIRLAALGERSTISAMQVINQQLGIPARGRKVSGIAYRGEMIVRTEVGRAYNLANYSQQQVTAQSVPGLGKQWLATGDRRTRIEHLRAHGQIVPVNEPFIVGGEKLDYPLDPSASAQMTINCRCRTVTIHPEIGPISGPLDGKIEKELERRQESAGYYYPSRLPSIGKV